MTKARSNTRGFIFRRRSILSSVLAVLTAIATVGVVTSPANAYTGADFNPSMIISDEQFYDASAMTEAEIQQFLEKKINAVGGCVQTSWNCLAKMLLTTPSRPASLQSGTNKVLCKAYEGASLEPVSRIIFKVQQACSISAKVLLVTLQKEQGLITNRDPSDAKVNRAMGYMCPDSANGGCGAAGFHQQMYGAAWQFQYYVAAPTRFRHRAGATVNVGYHPNTACGSASVYISNNATAGLYNYTPYTPNAAALANLGGTGNSCSSYGNRNFWNYYYSWFGSPIDVFPKNVAFERLGGSGRIEVATGVSQNNYDPSTNVVYIANALNFPDALSAAPAAALAGAPLLLVEPTALNAGVKAELQRLTPTSIVVVGGPGSVSPAVFDELNAIAPAVRRDGFDRYESSRSTVSSGFPGGAATVYIATGEGFADALSAASVAASKGFPVLLVPGKEAAVDAPTLQLLDDLGTTNVVIVGGPASVTPGFESSLVTSGLAVTRFSGQGRYDVSAAINRASFGSASTVYFASGENFPDALAGAALAGKNKSPLYLVQPSCVPRPMIEDVINFGATKVVVFGGAATVGADVLAWNNC